MALQKFTFETRLYLQSKGTLVIANTLVENLVELSYGSAMYIESRQLSVSLVFSDFHNCSCTSTTDNFGGTICVRTASFFGIDNCCFSYNFGFGSPDVILWGDSTRNIDLASINTSSFCRSSTQSNGNSCSNWFVATLLTLYSINMSSMSSKVRCSAFAFGSKDGVNIPKMSFVLVDNSTTANYVIEIWTVSSSQMQVLDHFVITNCAASTAVISNKVSASYILLFEKSVLNNITCPYNRWVDSGSLTLSFFSSYIMDAPPIGSHSVSGSTDKWDGDYDWPDVSECVRRVYGYVNGYECSIGEKTLKANKIVLMIGVMILFKDPLN